MTILLCSYAKARRCPVIHSTLWLLANNCCDVINRSTERAESTDLWVADPLEWPQCGTRAKAASKFGGMGIREALAVAVDEELVLIWKIFNCPKRGGSGSDAYAAIT
jgi:hypothetical protein